MGQLCMDKMFCIKEISEEQEQPNAPQDHFGNIKKNPVHVSV